MATRPFPKRHAISRARFFLQLAEECPGTKRDEFEAFLEATIVFARAAIHRVKSKYETQPGWAPWWDALLSDASLNFIRNERDWILKDAPPKIGQVTRLGGAGGGPPVPAARASELYYYESPDTPATETVGKHVDAVERAVREADSKFGATR